MKQSSLILAIPLLLIAGSALTQMQQMKQMGPLSGLLEMMPGLGGLKQQLGGANFGPSWTPDGKQVLFASSRESGRQRFNQFYTVGTAGGLPEKLPIPYGEFGAYAQDGHRFAYMPISTDFRTWKRYRGGWSPDIFTSTSRS